jgi:hypothetical protein
MIKRKDKPFIILHCNHCEHEWKYTGASIFYTSCPKCRYNVRIVNLKENSPQIQDEEEKEEEEKEEEEKEEEEKELDLVSVSSDNAFKRNIFLRKTKIGEQND